MTHPSSSQILVICLGTYYPQIQENKIYSLWSPLLVWLKFCCLASVKISPKDLFILMCFLWWSFLLYRLSHWLFLEVCPVIPEHSFSSRNGFIFSKNFLANSLDLESLKFKPFWLRCWFLMFLLMITSMFRYSKWFKSCDTVKVVFPLSSPNVEVHNHILNWDDFSLTRDFSFVKSPWISLEGEFDTSFATPFINKFVSFFGIIGILWLLESFTVDPEKCLTLMKCPCPQCFFHNTVYYWVTNNDSGCNWPLTIIYWFVFFC